ncbi:major facilitator superfamily domain-containing protein [Coprinopsis sp. MPI-PUGE-AT-0042]|nr:major facilitator superfamily domain-containing protein [Coprinopsis sp. MPI-PUGE-AT-0042]
MSEPPAPLVADAEDAVIDINTPVPYRTSLPKLQLGILCLTRLTDPITFTQIFPYINQLLTNLHLVQDSSQIGFYSGLVESTFAFFQLISIYEWAKISERCGRRPVVIWGTFGLALATATFGLAQNLWTILLSRALAGLCSGNAAVLHSVLGELTDATNQHAAFPIYALAWPLGSILGPLLGGSLADPAKRYPQIFKTPFLEKFPYFLPCFVAGGMTFIAACLASVFLEETHPFKRKVHEHEHYERSINFVNIPKERRLTIKELLAIPAIRALTISGAALCFSGTAFDAVFVLHCFTEVDQGGLGFPTSKIGYALSIAGLISIFLQISFMPTVLRKFDTAKVYNFCMWMWPLCYLLLPVLHILLHSKYLLWVSIAVLLGISRVACLAYSVSMVLVKENSPSPFTLGQSNGLVTFAMCASRAIAPAFVSAIYAWTIQYNIMHGYFWVAVMVIISLLGCSLSGNIAHPEGHIRL